MAKSNPKPVVTVESPGPFDPPEPEPPVSAKLHDDSEARLLATGFWKKTDKGTYENLVQFSFGGLGEPAQIIPADGFHRPLDEALALEAHRGTKTVTHEAFPYSPAKNRAAQ